MKNINKTPRVRSAFCMAQLCGGTFQIHCYDPGVMKKLHDDNICACFSAITASFTFCTKLDSTFRTSHKRVGIYIYITSQVNITIAYC